MSSSTIRITKTERSLPSLPKRTGWVGVKAFPPILPDEMERVVQAVGLITGQKVDWYIRRGSTSHKKDPFYFWVVTAMMIGNLPTIKSKNAAIKALVVETLEWLAPVCEKSRAKVETIGLAFEPANE